MIDLLKYHIIGKPRARAFKANQYHELFDLWQLRIVNVAAKGRSITEIYIDVSNRLDQPLRVLISPGTYFDSQGSHQNMVTRKETVFFLKPRGTKFLTVFVACINADRPIPCARDAFRGVKKVPSHVERFLRASQDLSANSVQAGVWALTDGYTRSQIQERLQQFGSLRSSGAAISNNDITAAKQILDQLGIPNSLD